MYYYQAYDLKIQSELLLPQLVMAEAGAPDVVIRLDKLNYQPQCVDREEGLFPISEKETGFFWNNSGTFLVRNGNEIVIDPVAGVDDRMINVPLSGAILAVLLHQRGLLVLHASAVAIDGEVAVFMGGKGWGKSTVAATLYNRGHSLLADDVVALEITKAEPRVISGYPQFRLWPDAAAASLGDDPSTLPQLFEGYDKRARRLHRFSHNKLPLGALYKLSKGPEVKITRLSPQAALVELIGNSFVARYGNQILRGRAAENNLEKCSNVISQAPFYRLERPHSLDVLPHLANLVEDQHSYDRPERNTNSPAAGPSAVSLAS